MKRALILCLFMLLSAASAECATSMFPPLQPLQSLQPDGGVNALQNYSSNNATSVSDPFVNSSNTNYSNIIPIEQSLFGRSFQNQSISARLSRIEKTLFTTTYPNSSDAQRIDNIILNFNQINRYPNISKNELSRMESNILSQKFPQNGSERRIERLEQQVFGAVQSGDLTARYEALKKASKSYNRNNMDYNNLAQGGQGMQSVQGGWRGIANCLSNSFWGGSMTGFTPPISPYYTYNSGNNNYNNYNAYSNPYLSGSGMYKGYRSNHGYSDSFHDYSSGAGVTILD